MKKTVGQRNRWTCTPFVEARAVPLLLIHGLGSTWRSWLPVLDTLASKREVIAVDLPGFGESPPLPSTLSIAALADSIIGFMTTQGLIGADLVGSSMGARIVLELARRGATGNIIALNPGGFWNKWQLRYFEVTLKLSTRLVRALQPVMPHLPGTPPAAPCYFHSSRPLPGACHRDWPCTRCAVMPPLLPSMRR